MTPIEFRLLLAGARFSGLSVSFSLSLYSAHSITLARGKTKSLRIWPEAKLALSQWANCLPLCAIIIRLQFNFFQAFGPLHSLCRADLLLGGWSSSCWLAASNHSAQTQLSDCCKQVFLPCGPPESCAPLGQQVLLVLGSNSKLRRRRAARRRMTRTRPTVSVIIAHERRASSNSANSSKRTPTREAKLALPLVVLAAHYHSALLARSLLLSTFSSSPFPQIGPRLAWAELNRKNSVEQIRQRNGPKVSICVPTGIQ